MIFDPPSSVEQPSIAVHELLAAEALQLDAKIVAGQAGLDRCIEHPRIQKSGLALVGHLHGIVPTRVQVLGETELSFIESLSHADQERAAAHLCSLKLACVLVTRGVEPPTALAEQAQRTDTPLVVCQERSSVAITAVHTFLDEHLAPRLRLHGVLMDVFEVGVLMLGKSFVGKSETALELIMRGHRLVADDVVECDYRPPGLIFGEAPRLLRHHIEVRGLGILDIADLYGVTSVRDRKKIDLVAMLELADADARVDRLGLEAESYEILGVPIRMVTIPVRPGRNTSAIIEIAARQELLRQAGHDSARAFVERVDAQIEQQADPKPKRGSGA